jgi:hypothetical protein
MMKLNLLLLSAAALFNGATAAADTVELGTAGDYAILTKAGISTVPSSPITGNIGVSPAAATYMTGFNFLLASDGSSATAPQLRGTGNKAYAASYGGDTPTRLTTAVSDMEIAYAFAAGHTEDADTNEQIFNELNGGLIGGLTLTPGVYTFDTDISITADVTLEGNENDVFIIRTTKNVVQADNTAVILGGNVQAKNIFWQVAEAVEVGTSATLNGILLVKTKAVFKTGSTLNGRVLAQTACTLDHTTVTEPTA